MIQKLRRIAFILFPNLIKQNEINDNTDDIINENKISMINICLTYAINESNVYWQRNAIYLTINSIMLGVLAFSENLSKFLFFVICIFGVFLNWYWPHVNKYSKYLAEKWREDARKIARENIYLERHFCALLKTSTLEVPKGLKPSKVMNTMSLAFKILWIVLSIYTFCGIYREVILLVGSIFSGGKS